jgi:hypothetical protein
MLKTSITFFSVLFFFILLYSCKTSESSQSGAMNEQTRQELLQSSIDTAMTAGLSPEEIHRITLMAMEAAKLYCNIKQFEDKDMSVLSNSKAYDKLNSEYTILQGKVSKLDNAGKLEYDRVFEESKAKCD